MDPHAYCQERAAASGSSFYYAFRFLDPERRRAITALYAFCREVDDVVDECRDPGVARTKLGWWREELSTVYEGGARHPVTRALRWAARRYALPREHLEAVIEGVEMDLAHGGFDDMAALRAYCHRVAGVVGLLSAEIFGYRNPATLDYAHELGIALQLTNILRDVGEDARRGRVYLPRDLLAAHGVRAVDLRRGETTPAVRALLSAFASEARAAYARALERLPMEDRWSQRAGLVMAAIYQALLEEIARDGYRVVEHRVALTPIRKLWIAWRTHRRERRRAAA